MTTLILLDCSLLRQHFQDLFTTHYAQGSPIVMRPLSKQVDLVQVVARKIISINSGLPCAWYDESFVSNVKQELVKRSLRQWHGQPNGNAKCLPTDKKWKIFSLQQSQRNETSVGIIASLGTIRRFQGNENNYEGQILSFAKHPHTSHCWIREGTHLLFESNRMVLWNGSLWGVVLLDSDANHQNRPFGREHQNALI
jgi:hypothetical protein